MQGIEAVVQYPVPLYRNISMHQACHNNEFITETQTQSLLSYSMPPLSTLICRGIANYTTEVGSLYFSSWHWWRTWVSGHPRFRDEEIRAQRVLNFLPKPTGLQSGRIRTQRSIQSPKVCFKSFLVYQVSNSLPGVQKDYHRPWEGRGKSERMKTSW